METIRTHIQYWMIRYDGQQISTEQTEKVQTEFTSVALLGTVSCGVPTLEEEYIEEYVSLPVSMFGNGTFFLLRANGESMIDAGISPGAIRSHGWRYCCCPGSKREHAEALFCRHFVNGK